jgi:hypothetical protein
MGKSEGQMFYQLKRLRSMEGRWSPETQGTTGHLKLGTLLA